jgi:two-component system response regulator AdeR
VASAAPLAPLVVVIDDDPDALAICEYALRAAGYRTATAASGEAGLGLLAQVDAALVVLDLAMPGLDGFAVAEEIRRGGTTAPILIFTGLPRDQAARAQAVGATAVCAKPIEPQRFVAAVRRLCPLPVEEMR